MKHFAIFGRCADCTAKTVAAEPEGPADER